MRFLLLISPLLLLLTNCSPRLLDKPYSQEKTQALYSDVIGDAAKPQPWEISNSLTPISSENTNLIRKQINDEEYILVSTWKDDTSYYKNDPKTGTYNTSKYPIWVTVAPELQKRCQEPAFGRREGLNLRIKQLLGLPPDAKKQYFIEFWVRPSDLFRPCPDPETDDRSCSIEFPEKTTELHRSWINNLRINSYYNLAWNQNYPWTELGYTYDWNKQNKSHVGLSEFVIKNNSEIIVKQSFTTEEYCKVQTSKR